MDVHHVGYGLECIETDTHGQDQVQRHRSRTETHQSGKIDKAVSEEIEVFEHTQKGERGDDTRCQSQFSRPVSRRITAGGCAHQIADHGDQQDQAEKPPVPGAVEDVGGQREDALAPQIITQGPDEAENDGEEKEEAWLNEQHADLLRPTASDRGRAQRRPGGSACARPPRHSGCDRTRGFDRRDPDRHPAG